MNFSQLKISCFILAGFLLSALGGAACIYALEGYYSEEEVRTFHPIRGPDQTVIRKSWYASDRMRKDEDWMGITIARFDLDRIYILDQHTKTYRQISADLLREFSPQSLSAFGIQNNEGGGLDFPDDLYIRTETTKRIGLWSCYQVMTNPKYRSPRAPYIVFWYSLDVDFPVQLYGDQLKQIFGNTPEVGGLFNRLAKFDGYPVRTEAHGTGLNTVTTLIKIERRTDINPALFEVPTDYTEETLIEDIPSQR